MIFFKQVILSLLGVSFFVVAAGAATEVEHHDFTVDSSDHTACLECHDALDISMTDSSGKACDNGVTSSHPAGTDYPPTGKKKLFNSRGFIAAKGLNLSDGKITCLSCHNLQNGNAKHLAINNVGSKLCLTCHHT